MVVLLKTFNTSKLDLITIIKIFIILLQSGKDIF